MKKIFLSAILAGAVIAFGGTVFLSVENTVVGSIFFTIGLFVVCTRVFILCGFEHCVANMYYFTMGGAWSGRAVLYLLVMTVGNAAGGVIGPLARKVLSR